MSKGDTSGIFVGVRVRPFVPREIKAKDTRGLNVKHGQLYLTNPGKGEEKVFAFDVK
jgi:hypothetical protein